MSLIPGFERSRLLTVFALAFTVLASGHSGPLRAEDSADESPAVSDEASATADGGATNGEKAASPPSEDAAPAKAAEGKPAETMRDEAQSGDEKSAKAKPGSRDDYYAKRAKDMLKADEQAADMTPHPLAAAHPDKYVVVCEAGCGPDKGAKIVYMAPRPDTEVATISSMVPTSSSGEAGAAAEDDNTITCTAGCYDSPKSYKARALASGPAGAAVNAPGAAFGNTWVTTVEDSGEQAKANPSGSGAWMARINREREESGSAVVAAAEPAPVPAKAAAPAAVTAPAPVESKSAAVETQEATASKTAAAAAAAAEPATETESKKADSKTDVAMPEAPAKAPEMTILQETAPPAAPAAKPEAPGAANTPEQALSADTDEGAADAAAGTATESGEPGAKNEAAATDVAPEADVATPAEVPAESLSDAQATADKAAADASEPPAAATEPDAGDGGVAPHAEAHDADAAAAPVAADEKKAEAAPAATAEAAAETATEPEKKVAALEAEAEPSADAAVPAAVPAPAEEAPAASGAPAAAPAKVAAVSDQVVSIETDDPEMNQAIKKARGSLPSFWSALEAAGEKETNFSLKVAIAGNGSVEHFWVVDIKREGEKITGTINNEPEMVKTVSMGQTYEFSEKEITDWLFKRNGKMVGNETMRPLLKRMSKEEAAPYWSMYEKP